MTEKDEPERFYDAWQNWANNTPPWRRAAHDDGQLRGLPEWCDTEGERFDGAWLLQDGCASAHDSVYALCMARLLALRIVSITVKRQLRGEDVIDDVATAAAYVQALELDAVDAGALHRLLGALQPFQPAAVADELVGMAWSALRAELDGSARCCALMAYDCAYRFGAAEAAAGAARALALQAELQECPRTARRWRGRAYVHQGRALRARVLAL